MLTKTKPWNHQIKALEASLPHAEYALFMEMRTGKSLVVIETALQYRSKGINAMLVLAPNGVHSNWVAEGDGEVATHWPDDVPYTMIAWSPKTTKRYIDQLNAALSPTRQDGRFVIFAMNYEALTTTRGAAYATAFLKRYKALLVADESDLLKSPAAARTKMAFKLAPLAAARRILTGTPVTQAPLDVWAQFNFLRPGILHRSYATFKARHCKLLPKTHPMVAAMMRKNRMRFPPAIPETDEDGKPIYAHLDELAEACAKHSYRVLRTDCRDMPPKNYLKVRIEMPPEQHSVYQQMRTEYSVQLASGEEVDGLLVLTRMMRLQQIVGGFLGDEPIVDPSRNPRINAVLDIVAGTTGKVIIWARYIPEVLAIHNALTSIYGRSSAATYYGATSQEDRLEYRRQFLLAESPLRFMVGQPSSGGVGVPMHSADTVIYYSNEFKLRTRLQSEDRAQHMDKKTPVEYYDLECPGTMDTKVITALRNKHDVARMVTGDNWREWI